jgi:ribosomal protein S24E
MQILEKKESKLLGRTDVDVLFPQKAGALTRKDAVKEVAQSMKVEEGKVALLKLASGSGSRDLVGTFRVYGSEADVGLVPAYLKTRMLTKEEREAVKAAKKKAEQAAAQAKQQKAGTKK